MESLGGFAIAAVVLYSGYTVIIRGNPPGSLFSFITSVIMLYEPMKRVARLHVDLVRVAVRRRHALRLPRRARLRGGSARAPELEVTQGRIEFRDVVFGYRPGESACCIRSASSPRLARRRRWSAARAAASRR